MTRFSQKITAALILAAFSGLSCTPSPAQTTPRSTLLQFNFNDGKSWPDAWADVMPSTPIDLATTFEVKSGIGTPDAATKTASPALLIGAEVGEVNLNWTASYASGILAINNPQTDLQRLKLSLNLSASAAKPIKVQIESFDAKKRRTGGLETALMPKNADIFEAFEVPLSDCKPFGDGKFRPDAAFVQFTFVLEAPIWTNQTTHQIRIDDLILTDSSPKLSP